MSDWIEKANALADGELEGEELREAQSAVATDASASAEHQWALYIKSTLREKLPPVENPELWQTCRARLAAIDKSRGVETFVGKYAWAFCLAFLAPILVAALFNQMGMSRPLSNAHMAGLFNGLTPLQPGQALDQVGRSFGAPAEQVRDMARVLEVATGNVDGRRAARFLLDDGKGAFYLFVILGTNAIEGIEQPDSGYLCGRINGWPAVSWANSGKLFLIVAPRDRSELIQMSDAVRSH